MNKLLVALALITVEFSAATILAMALATPPALAVEDNDTGGNADKAKSCPRGARYSERKGRCVKTSCGTGQVWSSGVEACVDGNSAALTDEDLYLAGRDLGQEARYVEALQLFFRMKNREQARVLSSSVTARASSAILTRALTIIIRRLSAIPTTRRHANISARPIYRRVTSGRRRSSSSRSPTAVAVLATIMNSW